MQKRHFGNKKFLVVDDEPMIREVIRDLLELHDAQVVEAEDGLQAYEKIQKEKFDFVISDVRMPKCSGEELLDKLKNHPKPAPQIIMMSAFSDLTNEKAKSKGAIALVMKPTQMDQLLDLIEDNLR